MFKLEMETGNAAFGDRPEEEVARLLDVVAVKLQNGATTGNILDGNGTTVGTFWFEDGE